MDVKILSFIYPQYLFLTVSAYPICPSYTWWHPLCVWFPLLKSTGLPSWLVPVNVLSRPPAHPQGLHSELKKIIPKNPIFYDLHILVDMEFLTSLEITPMVCAFSVVQCTLAFITPCNLIYVQTKQWINIRNFFESSILHGFLRCQPRI